MLTKVKNESNSRERKEQRCAGVYHFVGKNTAEGSRGLVRALQTFSTQVLALPGRAICLSEIDRHPLAFYPAFDI